MTDKRMANRSEMFRFAMLFTKVKKGEEVCRASYHYLLARALF